MNKIFQTKIIHGLVTLTGYTGTEADVVIPEGIQSIGRRSFEKCRSMISLTTPTSLLIIEEEAFNCCDQLKNINLSEGLKEIRHRAFWYCSSLTSITFPNSLHLIGSRAFECCSNLKEIHFLYNGIFIDEYAFNETPYHRNMLAQAHRCTVRSGYSSCPAHLQIPEGETHIDHWFYAKSEIRTAILPNSLRTIGISVFRDCRQLQTVTLSPNIKCNPNTESGPMDGIFSGCRNLETLIFRGKVRDVFCAGFDPEKTFAGCNRMKQMIAWEIPLHYFPKQWNKYVLNGYLYDNERSSHYPPEIAAEYEITLEKQKESLINRTIRESTPSFYNYLIERSWIGSKDYNFVLENARSHELTEIVSSLLVYKNRQAEQLDIPDPFSVFDDFDL